MGTLPRVLHLQRSIILVRHSVQNCLVLSSLAIYNLKEVLVAISSKVYTPRMKILPSQTHNRLINLQVDKVRAMHPPVLILRHLLNQIVLL